MEQLEQNNFETLSKEIKYGAGIILHWFTFAYFSC